MKLYMIGVCEICITWIVFLCSKRGLDETVKLWNCHRIRQSRFTTAPYGKPVTMYYLPHLYSVEDHICPVTVDQIQVSWPVFI